MPRWPRPAFWAELGPGHCPPGTRAPRGVREGRQQCPLRPRLRRGIAPRHVVSGSGEAGGPAGAVPATSASFLQAPLRTSGREGGGPSAHRIAEQVPRSSAKPAGPGGCRLSGPRARPWEPESGADRLVPPRSDHACGQPSLRTKMDRSRTGSQSQSGREGAHGRRGPALARSPGWSPGGRHLGSHTDGPQQRAPPVRGPAHRLRGWSAVRQAASRWAEGSPLPPARRASLGGPRSRHHGHRAPSWTLRACPQCPRGPPPPH